MLNTVEVVFNEQGFTYEPIKVDSVFQNTSNPFLTDSEGLKKLRKSSLIDDLCFDKDGLNELICS